MSLTISRLALGGALLVLVMTGVARAGLSEAERITLDQPACAQMKAFSQDITLLNDEMQNMRRFGARRLCEVLGRSITTISNTVDYMRSHVGECTITDAKVDDLASSYRKLEADRRRVCR
jgi:CHASE1-domain containing sensor protein